MEVNMKHTMALCVPVLLLLLCLPAVSTTQELPYKDGPVWAVSFVRTKPGMTNDYLKNLAEEWRNVNEEAKKEGLVLSYKILSGEAANKDDWNLMLMVEFKNFAALDGVDAKFEAIAAKLIGSEQQQKAGTAKRSELREIFGGKIVRELILK
jgi:hypothetical protein